MKTLINICVLFFIFSQSAYANDKIAYLDIDFVLTNSDKGKSIIKILEEKNKNNIIKLKEKEKILEQLEKDIEKKKNILSKDELNIQVDNLKKNIINFRNEKEKLVNDFNNLKKKEISRLMNLINPIITEYVKEKSISVVLDKKNVLIGKKNYDITNNILELVNIKLK